MLPDNLRYSEPTSGQPVATDLVSGAHFQRVKLDVGSDGNSVPITGTTAYGIPVDVRTTSIDTVSASGIPTSPRWAQINATVAGDDTVVPGVPGKRIRVLALTLTVKNNISIAFKSGAVTVKIPAMFISQGTPLDVNRMPFGFFLETDPGDPFVINLSGNTVVAGSITYIEA